MARRDGGHTNSQSGSITIRLLSSKGSAPLLMSYRLISISNLLNHQSHNFRRLPDSRSNLKIRYWWRTQTVNKAKMTYNQSRLTRQRERRSQLPQRRRRRRRRRMPETGASRQLKRQLGYTIRHQPPYQALLHLLLWLYKISDALSNQLQSEVGALGGCWTGVSEVVFSADLASLASLASLSSGSVFGPSINGPFLAPLSSSVKWKWRPAFDPLQSNGCVHTASIISCHLDTVSALGFNNTRALYQFSSMIRKARMVAQKWVESASSPLSIRVVPDLVRCMNTKAREPGRCETANSSKVSWENSQMKSCSRSSLTYRGRTGNQSDSCRKSGR